MEKAGEAFGTQAHAGAGMLGRGRCEENHAGTYLHCHLLEAVARIRHNLAKSEYGAEGIRPCIINARLEIGGGYVGEDVPSEVGEEAESKQGQLRGQPDVLFKRRVNAHCPAPTYLLKLNLGYQMLFFTKRVKFSAAFKKAGLEKESKWLLNTSALRCNLSSS